MTGVDEMVAAAARQPGGTLLLRSDRLTPAELADEVLARVGLRQVHADDKRMRQARSLERTASQIISTVTVPAADQSAAVAVALAVVSDTLKASGQVVHRLTRRL